MLSRCATNTNFIVFDLTKPGLTFIIYHIQGNHGNHYTTNAVLLTFKTKKCSNIKTRLWWITKAGILIGPPFPMCSCGKAEQDTAHILQTCRNHQALREEIWPLPTTLQEKLHGPVDALQKTTRFVAETELQV